MRVCGSGAVSAALANVAAPIVRPFRMPVEFAVAAYRFGHSMVRAAYDFNLNFRPASLAQLFTFTALSGNFAPSVGIGFDFEGVPKKRVPVIDRGIATGPVTDWRTSRKLNLELTGHHSGSTEFGPYAAHLVLEPGKESLGELIAGVDNGLLVTRFHYVNVLDRPATLLTGMTRDGTFRIRKGEVAGPVHNFSS